MKKFTKFEKYFTQGYCCALANMIKSHGNSTPIEESFRANYASIKDLRKMGIETLLPVIKECERKIL